MYMSENLKRVARETVASGEQPCVSLKVYHGEREVFCHCEGMPDKEKGVPVDDRTIYRLYSMTKPFTAVALMRLVEEGRIDLAANVSRYLPKFKHPRVAVNGTETPCREIQVRDLMTMTAGLSYPNDTTPAGRATAEIFLEADRRYRAGTPMSTYEMMNEIGGAPLDFAPGEKWQYSVCADVLGAIIEIVSGKKLCEYMDDIIFKPLDMRDTAFYVPQDKRDRLMPLMRYRDGKLTAAAGGHLMVFDYDAPPAFQSGGAGLFGTLHDSMLFARMLMRGGELNGARVLQKASVDFLSSNHLTDGQMASRTWESESGTGYGALVRVMLEPGKAMYVSAKGEFGWDGWTGPNLTVCPERKIAFVAMLQRTDTGATEAVRRMHNIVFSSIE